MLIHDYVAFLDLRWAVLGSAFEGDDDLLDVVLIEITPSAVLKGL